MADRSDDDFLSRWSRRKKRARSGTAEPNQATPGSPPVLRSAAVPSAPPPDPGAATESEGDPDIVAKLPDIESLDDSSDFTVFLQEGVPEALRRQALRKLWRVNPVLANLDGLNNYDEDYTKLGMVSVPDLKSLFRAGQGMVRGEDPEAETTGAGPLEESLPEPGGREKSAPGAAELPAPEAEPQAGPEPGSGSAGPAPRSAGRPAARRGAAERRWGRFRS